MSIEPIIQKDIEEIERNWQDGRFDAAYWMEDIISMLKERLTWRERCKKAERDAERWRSFNQDCTCGAATVHTKNGVISSGKEWKAKAERYLDLLKANGIDPG